MRNKLSFMLILAVFAGAVTAYAHHSVAALYDDHKTVKIEGRLVSFSFRSPHSIAIVEGPDAQGKVQRYSVLWNAARTLSGQGITRDFFKPGDKLVITGNPGRNPEDHLVKMVTLLRTSDGFKWGDAEGQTFQ